MQARLNKETIEVLRASTLVVFAKKYMKNTENITVAVLFVDLDAYPFYACTGAGDFWNIQNIENAKIAIRRRHNKTCEIIERLDVCLRHPDDFKQLIPK